MIKTLRTVGRPSSRGAPVTSTRASSPVSRCERVTRIDLAHRTYADEHGHHYNGSCSRRPRVGSARSATIRKRGRGFHGRGAHESAALSDIEIQDRVAFSRCVSARDA